MNNSIRAIGYQLEKAHTGALTLLLDSRRGYLSSLQKAALLAAFGLDASGEPEILCIPEYSYGRRTKIDLVIKIGGESAGQHLILEMKTDSAVDTDQLKRIRAEVAGEGLAHPEFVLMTLGASIATLPKPLPEVVEGFRVVTPVVLLETIELVRSDKHHEFISDWIAELRAEELRRANVFQNLRQKDTVRAHWRHWMEIGYRVDFPLFFYAYDVIRNHFHDREKWRIYSGGNNPVMNYDHWIPVDGCEYYFEFNFESLRFKMHNPQARTVSRDGLSKIRDHVATVCDNISNAPNGARTSNRFGEYVSLYAWQFDFTRDEPELIAETTNRIITELAPQIGSF